MAGRTPNDWVGQDVTVGFGPGDKHGRDAGKLEAFTDAGVVLRKEPGDWDEFAFYPMTSIHRVVLGNPPQTGAPSGVRR